MVDTNTLMVLSSAVVMVLTRSGLFKTQRTFRKFGEEDDDSNNSSKNSPYNEFKHSSTLILKYDLSQRVPAMIKQFKEKLLLVTFSDGLTQIIQYSPMLIQPSPIRPQDAKPILGQSILLGEFMAHHFQMLAEKEVIINMFDASKCETFGTNCYLQEVFTLGSDARIVHWGIRYVLDQEDAVADIKLTSEEALLRESKEEEDIDLDKIIYTEEVTCLNIEAAVIVDYLGVSDVD